jgi:hypothetical protein
MEYRMQNELTNLNVSIVDYANALASYRCYVESCSEYDEETSQALWDDVVQAQTTMNKEIEHQLNPWQPIESAPKGSDSILLGEPSGSVSVAYWGHPLDAMDSMDRAYAWCDESTDYAIKWATHWKRKPTAPSKE